MVMTINLKQFSSRLDPRVREVPMRRLHCPVLLAVSLCLVGDAAAQQGRKWVVSWTASAQGPHPIGNPSAQPDQRFAFPSAETGASDQTFRLIVRPDIWGRETRLRFTNAFGTKPLALAGVFVGLQLGGPSIVRGTNRPITFGGK